MKHLRATVVLCGVLVWPDSGAAQRVASSGFVARITDASPHEVTWRPSQSPALSASSLLLPSTAAPRATSSRGAHAGYGALLGAVIGGTVGFIVDRRDHTGEGFIAPVMIGGGAALGALIGALVGIVMPVHHDPAT